MRFIFLCTFQIIFCCEMAMCGCIWGHHNHFVYLMNELFTFYGIAFRFRFIPRYWRAATKIVCEIIEHRKLPEIENLIWIWLSSRYLLNFISIRYYSNFRPSNLVSFSKHSLQVKYKQFPNNNEIDTIPWIFWSS